MPKIINNLEKEVPKKKVKEPEQDGHSLFLPGLVKRCLPFSSLPTL
jgi:hypothetical protein